MSHPCLRQGGSVSFAGGWAGRRARQQGTWAAGGCQGPGSGPGRTFGKSQGLGIAARVPDCELVPVSSVIRSHDTIPGSPDRVLLLLSLKTVGGWM